MKNICLTFDDGLKSHYDVALPLLAENKLKGTFFICGIKNLWKNSSLGMSEEALDFNNLKDFVNEGMEIGNHSLTHRDLRTLKDEDIIKEVKGMNDLLSFFGIDDVKTFCYPGYHTDYRVASLIKSAGFTHARTGYIYDDTYWSFWNNLTRDVNFPRPPISYFPDHCESNWLIKSTGVLNYIYRFDDFVEDVTKMPDNAYAIFTFHGLVEKSLASDFKKIVNYISNEENLTTVNLKDLPLISEK